MRQAGADDDQRGVLLADLVAGGAERGQLVGVDVLHLVDEQPDADGQVGGQVGGVAEQLGEVHLQVAGVGPALRGDHVDRRVPADALAVVLRGAQGERLQDAAELLDPLVVAVPVAELAHRGVHRLGDRQPDALVRAGLDLAGAPGALHRQAAEGVEQDGLADAAQAAEDHAALGPAGGDAFEHDLELLTSASRPASSGGRCPAPGAYGFRIGSTIALYEAV